MESPPGASGEERPGPSATPEPVQPAWQPGTPTQLSPDRNHYWNGREWVSTISPDGKQRWNGTAWVPNRKMFLGDYANQSIASAIIGILCAPFFLFGFYAGYKAYQELPHKRTLAIVGLALNAAGALIWVASLVYRVATS